MKYLIPVFILLSACGYRSSSLPEVTVVIDKGLIKGVKGIDIYHRTMSHFQPYYLGPFCDTFLIDYSILNYSQLPVIEVPITPYEEIQENRIDSPKESIDTSMNPDSHFSSYIRQDPFKKFRAENFIFNGTSFEKNKRFSEVDSAKLSVFVDTNHVIRDLWYVRDSLGTKSYPVIIRNLDKDTAIVGYGNFVHLKVQAINGKGKWQEIMSQHVYYCGTGIYDLILPPDYILVTGVPCFNGDFRTKIRLKIGENYSNIFMGEINLKQFH